MEKTIGIVGLGKMGGNIARRLAERDWAVHGYDPAPEARAALSADGIASAEGLATLVERLPAPRLIWLMVPAPGPVEDALFGANGLAELLAPGDTVIDGGNTFYKDSVSHGTRLAEHGIRFLDVGFSGGPAGARDGGCLMIGGDQEAFEALEGLFRDLSAPDAYRFFPGAGAGHFVKMVHNGIEYGMMQALAEGFGVLKASSYGIDLRRAAEIYGNQSVIASRLVDWLGNGLAAHGEDLADISGTVGHTGEGAWTVQTAQELGVPTPVISASLDFRIQSEQHPNYIGKLLSMLRNQFGGHAAQDTTDPTHN